MFHSGSGSLLLLAVLLAVLEAAPVVCAGSEKKGQDKAAFSDGEEVGERLHCNSPTKKQPLLTGNFMFKVSTDIGYRAIARNAVADLVLLDVITFSSSYG